MSQHEEKQSGSAKPWDGSQDERWQLVQRVVQDESFRRAPRLRELLLFLTEKALSGRAIELNEHEIAVAVFRRPETFNSADDSIVRSSARQLRTKLHEHFEGPGRVEGLRIEIPKGSYVPEFPVQTPVAGAAEAGAGGAAAGGWKVGVLSSLATAAVLVTGFLLWNAGSAGRQETSTRAVNLVTWLFGNRGQEVNVVLCDSALVVVNAYRDHLLSLEDYIAQKEQQPLPLTGGNPSGATPVAFPGRRLITSFRDMVFVERLGELGGAAGLRVSLKHSRLMQVRDFRSGGHILLGSAWSNPWTTLFEEQLNFRFAEVPERRAFVLENTSPKQGEQRRYECTAGQAHDGVSYARIAVVPNLAGQESILLVSGLHTESSEGALDAALSPAFLEQIRQMTQAKRPADLHGVELLLEVRAVDGVVKGTRLLASRQHEPARPGGR